MTETELLPCPMCGSPAKLDYGGVLEGYHDWQTGSVECTDVNGKHCGMDIVIHMDFWYQPGSEQVLIDMWNRLARENIKGEDTDKKPSEALKKNMELTKERLAYYNEVMKDEQ